MSKIQGNDNAAFNAKTNIVRFLNAVLLSSKLQTREMLALERFISCTDLAAQSMGQLHCPLLKACPPCHEGAWAVSRRDVLCSSVQCPFL